MKFRGPDNVLRNRNGSPVGNVGCWYASAYTKQWKAQCDMERRQHENPAAIGEGLSDYDREQGDVPEPEPEPTVVSYRRPAGRADRYLAETAETS